MKEKLISINKIICSILIAFYLLYVSCIEPPVEDPYNNPNAGMSRELITFSHDSGLYAEQFELILTAPPESAIYYSIDGSIPSPGKVGNGFVFQYSSPITVQDRNGQPNILATPENSEQFYMVPDDPRGSVPGIFIPNDDRVPKATVIRAITVDARGRQSVVLTKTYFIGDNLANYAEHRIISLVTDPLGLVDEQYGIMVRGNPGNRWPNYNFNMRGLDWEREAYLELFEGDVNNRNVALSTGVGIRVRGGWSRGHGQKSLNVYFRGEYGGINNFRMAQHGFELIPGAVKADGSPVDITKSFMLRSGGTVSGRINFLDVFIQDMLSDRSFTTQASVPCFVYLNGEYWGYYNLQERYSDNHTEYKYGVNRNNVISYDNGELDDGTAEDLIFYNQMINMRNNDMSIQANYDAFCAVFDIENFIEYYTAQIYIFNADWPMNNYRLWRTRNPEQGNPYGDTKWRWQMFDTDLTLGVSNGGRLVDSDNRDAFDRIFNGTYSHSPQNLLFMALLENEDFCRQFVNTMMDLYNVNFHPDSFMPKLSNYETIYKPLMNEYYLRWGGSISTFEARFDDVRSYLNNIRPAMVNDYLPTYFGGYSGIADIGISASNLYDVTISTTGVHGASVKINTVTPDLTYGNWTGKYYSGNPITVTASTPPNGYEFDGWMVTEGGNAVTPSALTTIVNFTGNVQVTAKYQAKR